MITPNKYLDLELSLLNISGLVLRIIKENGVLKYDELLHKVILQKGEKVKDVFIQSLSFLYLLGKIEYNKKQDLIEYIHEA